MMDVNIKPNKYKKKKKDKKKKKRQRSSSSSSSSSSGSDEWVEASSIQRAQSPLEVQQNLLGGKKTVVERNENDEWASFGEQFRTISRDQLREKKNTKDDEKRNILDCPGQSERELNPYWKDGGSGLPKEFKDLGVTECAIGDHGLDWLRRALRRSKEQAAEEGRSLENVVAERWGSLEKLQSMIKEAERKAGLKDERKEIKDERNNSKLKHNDWHRGKDSSRNDRGKSDRDRSDKYNYRDNKSCRDRESTSRRFKKPTSDSSGDSDGGKHKSSGRRETTKRMFMKPNDDDYPTDRHGNKNEFKDRKLTEGRGVMNKRFVKPSDNNEDRPSTQYSRYTSGKGWRKQPVREDSEKTREDTKKERKEATETVVSIEHKEQKIETDVVALRQPIPLTADERNELAAKLMKAEILGNTELVKELKNRLEEARAETSAPEKIILTHTDAKGFTQPLSAPNTQGNSGRKREKVATHEGGKRVRYFADDDRFTLQDMFEREKRNTVEDQNEMFARLASKKIGGATSDMDDVFDEVARVKESEDKLAARAHSKAVAEHKRSSHAMDNCQWCLDSKQLLKHLLVAVGSKVYLCLPPHESLTEGHCLLVPSQHVNCGVQLDEEVWEELQTFRKTLVQLFQSLDMDIVFFEYAGHFNRFPHMTLQCVPLPKESGDVAPIYFKKAILECETEWSTNKKLVDLAGRNVRKAVPRGLPYFSVDFGLQAGYAHVIEDENLFPKNFAQEIIGGMLDIDHIKWRKPRKEKFEDQRKKVVEFTKLWQPFDFTKSEKG